MATKSHNDMLGMRIEGYREGFSDCTASVLDWLEDTYLSDELEDVKSPKGQAVLQLAKDLATEMRKPEFGKKRRESKDSTPSE